MTDPVSTQELLLRLLLAVVLGGAVGLERERKEWAAGLRTHMLICLGSALAMIVSAYGMREVVDSNRVILDPSRIASQVLGGIGFICAGTILRWRQEVIRGLTTAASLWIVAAIGLAVGAGLYWLASGATVCALVILVVIKLLEPRLFSRAVRAQLQISIDRRQMRIPALQAAIAPPLVGSFSLTLTREPTSETDTIVIDLPASLSSAQRLALVDRIRDLDGVMSVSVREPAGTGRPV